MGTFCPKLFVFLMFLISTFGCNNKKSASETSSPPPPPIHDGMCELINLGEASNAVEKKLPDNQYVTIEGMSSPKTLVWQDVTTQQLYYATKIMGSEGKLFYMDSLKTGEKPTIKSSFTGTLMLWKHLPRPLLISMKSQFKEQWGVNIDENKTYILQANQKPESCPK